MRKLRQIKATDVTLAAVYSAACLQVTLAYAVVNIQWVAQHGNSV